MEVIDTVDAETLVEGDHIRVDGEDVEIRAILTPTDPDEFTFKGFNLDTGLVDNYSLMWDERVEVLGT